MRSVREVKIWASLAGKKENKFSIYMMEESDYGLDLNLLLIFC